MRACGWRTVSFRDPWWTVLLRECSRVVVVRRLFARDGDARSVECPGYAHRWFIMTKDPAHLYTAIAGTFLLLQGTSTLAFRLYPPLDQAFPALLGVTQMVPPHSILHILTGVVALVAL